MKIKCISNNPERKDVSESYNLTTGKEYTVVGSYMGCSVIRDDNGEECFVNPKISKHGCVFGQWEEA